MEAPCHTEGLFWWGKCPPTIKPKRCLALPLQQNPQTPLPGSVTLPHTKDGENKKCQPNRLGAPKPGSAFGFVIKIALKCKHFKALFPGLNGFGKANHVQKETKKDIPTHQL